MTMQSQYKSKVPNNNKKFKKKDTSSTATFRKMTGMQSNYLVVGQIEPSKMKKNKSSRSRLKTVDSKGKLSSSNRGLNDNGKEPSEKTSSGKKKRMSNKKLYKHKLSPKSISSAEITGRLYSNNRSKDFQNKVKFHPLTKETSASFIRKSMNF